MIPDAANAGVFTSTAFIALPLLVMGLALYALLRSSKRRAADVAVVAAAFAGWLAITGAAAASGKVADFAAKPPLLPILVIIGMAGAVAFTRSRFGIAIVEQTPLCALIAFHAFRFLLELAMGHAAQQHVMPSVMSFAGYNFDIVTGATALVLAYSLHRGHRNGWAPRWLVVAWNCMGLGFLIIVGGLAIAATPMFEAFGPAQRNTWIAHVPFVWLPTVLVPAALAGHIMVFRKLGQLQRANTAVSPTTSTP